MSRVGSQDSIDSLESYDSMDSLNSYVSDDLLEALTLSSEEMERAREEALKLLAMEPPSPEEASKKNLSEGGSQVGSDGTQLRKKAEAAATKPPKAADGKRGVCVMQPPPKS